MVSATRESSVLKRFYSGTFAPPADFHSTARGPEVTAEEILAGGVRESDWSFPVLISTPSEDRQGDVVIPEGGEFAAFAESPIIFFDHQEIKFPVGKMRGPDGRLYFLVLPGVGILGRIWIRQPKSDDPSSYAEACKTVWVLVRDGLLNGISAGFDPIGPVKDLPGGGSLYKRWELLEVSIVPVAANRDCRVLREPLAWDERVLKRFTPSVIKGLRSMSSPIISKHIRHEGDEWILYDHTGKKVLGRHQTREEAVKQEEAVKASEARSKSYGIQYRHGEWAIRNRKSRGVLSRHKTRAECISALRALHVKGLSESSGTSGSYTVPEEHKETCKCLAARMKDHDAKGHEIHFHPGTGEVRHVFPDSASKEQVKSIAADLHDVPGVKGVTQSAEAGPKEEEGFARVYPRKDMGGDDTGDDDMMEEGHRSKVQKRARYLARVGKKAYRAARKHKLSCPSVQRSVRRIMPVLLACEMPEEKAIATAWGIACKRKGWLPQVVKDAADGDHDEDEDEGEGEGEGNTADTAEDAADDAAADAAMDSEAEQDQEGPDGLELVQTAIENLEAALPRLEPERRAFWQGIVQQIRDHGEETYPDEDFGGADDQAAEGAAAGANNDADEQKVTDEMLARYKGFRPRRIKRISVVRKLKSFQRDPDAADMIRKAANHLHEIGDMAMEPDEHGCHLKGYTPAHHRQARIRARELDRLHGALEKGEDKPRAEEEPRGGEDGIDLNDLMPRFKSLEAKVGEFVRVTDDVNRAAGQRRH